MPSVTVSGTNKVRLYAGATDGNFNWLAAVGSYDVSPINVAEPSYEGYQGLSQGPDTKGLSYVYWPCDAADQSRCANDCGAANSPPPERCLMRSVIRGFRYGYAPLTLVEGTGTSRDLTLLWEMRLLGTLQVVPLFVTFTP